MAILHAAGTRIAYDEYGRAAAGGAVLFIHGCALNRAMWEPQVEAMRGSYHLVVPDMRGHGSSEVPSFLTSIERMADDVRALVESLSLGPLVLIGHAMGAYVAIQYAVKYGPDVRGLVLAHARLDPDVRADVDERHRLIGVLRSRGTSGLADDLTPRLLSAETRQKTPALAGKVQMMIATTSAAGVASVLAGIASRPNFRSAFPAFVPALLVTGSEDAKAVADAEATGSAVPNARVTLVPGAGELVNLEAPAVFHAEVTQFVAGLGAEGISRDQSQGAGELTPDSLPAAI